jgi:hypothetical protein
MTEEQMSQRIASLRTQYDNVSACNGTLHTMQEDRGSTSEGSFSPDSDSLLSRAEKRLTSIGEGIQKLEDLKLQYTSEQSFLWTSEEDISTCWDMMTLAEDIEGMIGEVERINIERTKTLFGASCETAEPKASRLPPSVSIRESQETTVDP